MADKPKTHNHKTKAGKYRSKDTIVPLHSRKKAKSELTECVHELRSMYEELDLTLESVLSHQKKVKTDLVERIHELSSLCEHSEKTSFLKKLSYEALTEYRTKLEKEIYDRQNEQEKVGTIKCYQKKNQKDILFDKLYDYVLEEFIITDFQHEVKRCLLPVSIYLSNDDNTAPENHLEIIRNISDFLQSYDIEILFKGPPLINSFFQKQIYRVKDFFKRDDIKKTIKEMIGEGAHFATTMTVEEAQSKIDERRASSTAQIMEASKGYDNFMSFLGSVVIIKFKNHTGNNIWAFDLTANQLRKIRKKPGLLQSPEEMLRFLSTELGDDGSQRLPTDSG